MANYNAFSRTNYFTVSDEARYSELYKGLRSDGDEIHDFSYIENGISYHGFGAYGSIDWLNPENKDAEDPEYNFDEFIRELQKILPEDSAFILQEVGYEKLRYLTGYAYIVTKKKTASIDIGNAPKLAAEMLGKPDYKTRCSY